MSVKYGPHVEMMSISPDSSGPPSGCHAALEGECLDIKWLLIVGNDRV